MPFPVFTAADEWLQVADMLARHRVSVAVLKRHNITHALVTRVLEAEAAACNAAGLSTATAEQHAGATGVAMRDVLLIRAGLFHCGLLSKINGRSELVQLQSPRGYVRH